ncbi:MAG TPA: IMP cyclohydrolase [Desulfobacteraceae bacterium]|nr:IMP cyclohydrolase [Desulfobacteraceae bacterium]HPJ69165.1 IMP cyclohydrolase [Desulfobacteraceae bacterium]HPQ29812.1 IMP cyclohydrolase [Desulfobacteraceae bacterium]
MSDDLKKMYRTLMDDHFPLEITISFSDQKLIYRKRSWKIPDEKSGELIEKGLRYGENPGQEAALYELVEGNLILGQCRFIEPGRGLVSSITEEDMLQSGKHPGKINLTDVDNALNIIKYLTASPAVVIVKHNNPCGVAYGSTLAEAYEKANMADRIAAFGGCAVFNRPVDLATAEMISRNFLEVVAAPDFEEGTIEILSKSANLRIIRISRMDKLSEYTATRFVDFKSLIDGGIIVQQSPLNLIRSEKDFSIASTVYKGQTYTIERKPTVEEYADMLFGWQVEQGVTSNSVIYVKNGVTVGIGTGEQDRVGVAEIGIYKAYTKYADALCFKKHGMPYKELELMIEKGKKDADLLKEIDEETKKEKGGLNGSCMISDAFFPFRDGVDVAIRQGISGIVHPGGSIRDFESIQACNEADPKVSMVFTGQRAFRH